MTSTCHWQDCNRDTGYDILRCTNEAVYRVRVGQNAATLLCPFHKGRAEDIHEVSRARYGDRTQPLYVERIGEGDD